MFKTRELIEWYSLSKF